jgi:hypothetical protein
MSAIGPPLQLGACATMKSIQISAAEYPLNFVMYMTQVLALIRHKAARKNQTSSGTIKNQWMVISF